MDNIRNADFILLHTGSNQTVVAINLFNKYGMSPSIICKTTNPDVALNICSVSNALTFVPETGVAQLSCKEKLSFYTVDDPPLSWDLSLVYPRETYLSASARCFMQLLKDYYRSYHHYVKHNGLYYDPWFDFESRNPATDNPTLNEPA